MAHECFKCGGAGKIRGFEHVANGDCFQCVGTGRLMTRQERIALARANEDKRIEAHDLRLARQSGMTLEQFREYTRPKEATW